MLIDEKTRRDLELFRTRDGRPGVFGVLDRTRTPGGSTALRARFENPLSDPRTIREMQASLQFLIREEVSFPVQAELVEAVRRYFESSWDVGSRRRGLGFFVESVTVSLRYRTLLRHARAGIRATWTLLAALDSFLEGLRWEEAPAEIRRLAKGLRSTVDRLGRARVQGLRLPWRVFRADRILREEAREDLRDLLALLSDLDASCAMAEATKELGLAFPEFVDSKEFVMEGEGLFHVFLEEAVKNPVRLAEGRNVAFLTGPNMAGKTTYLKAVALAAYLAHLGMGVPARRFRLIPLEALLASLAPEEDLWAGLSYFMAEVRRVKEVAEVLVRGKRALVVFDEVFRGTNVKDALDASRLVILGFSRVVSSGFLFSSHLVELGAAFRSEARVRLLCFEGEIRDGRAQYGFRLKEGVSDQRFGIQLLEQEGVPRILSELAV